MPVWGGFDMLIFIKNGVSYPLDSLNVRGCFWVLKLKRFIFLKLKHVSVCLHILSHLWNRITSLWMNKSLKKAAWRFQLWTVRQVTAPLSLHNKESPALAVHEDTKKLSASPMPMYQEATEAVCKNSVRFRSDVWRETRYLTGRSICVDTHPCWFPEYISTCSFVAMFVASKF